MNKYEKLKEKGYTFQQVADLYGVTLNTVHVWVRGLKKDKKPNIKIPASKVIKFPFGGKKGWGDRIRKSYIDKRIELLNKGKLESIP